jgi:hypothetical protein
MNVGQDIFILRFEPPEGLERLLVDPSCPRTGPAVLLFADSINLDQWEAAPLEPQAALWTEVAIGYHCRVDGRETTAFHYPFLILSRQYGDPAIPVADIHMSRFHAACPGFEGPATGRRCEASAVDLAGLPIVDLGLDLRAPSDTALPDGLLRWVNRVRYPDVTGRSETLDAGLQRVWATDAQVVGLWRGDGQARFGAGIGWQGEVNGEAWVFGVTYGLRAGEEFSE